MDNGETPVLAALRQSDADDDNEWHGAHHGGVVRRCEQKNIPPHFSLA